MARSLIAVVSAHTRKAWRDAIRSTWLPMVPEGTDVRFFLGRGETTTQPDEVVLDCDDSYLGLPEKVQCIVRWAHDKGYSHVLKLDDDVVLAPKAMLDSGYDKFPYVGLGAHRPIPPTRPYFVAGGFAYWMDMTSMEYVIAAQLPPNNYDEGWVAGVLHEHGIELHADPRYSMAVCRTLPSVDKRRLAHRTRPDPVPGTFAWCIYFEPNGGTRFSTQTKIDEFKRVFAAEAKR